MGPNIKMNVWFPNACNFVTFPLSRDHVSQIYGTNYKLLLILVYLFSSVWKAKGLTVSELMKSKHIPDVSF
jgi:hypothetical protein